MPEQPVPLPVLIERRYGDRGKYKELEAIFGGPLGYDDKMLEVKNQWRVSLGTARQWYARWRRIG